jgi:hypothetical protein
MARESDKMAHPSIAPRFGEYRLSSSRRVVALTSPSAANAKRHARACAALRWINSYNSKPREKCTQRSRMMAMSKKTLDWTPDTSLPAGKGATVQRFTATDGADRLEIDTQPWGDGELTINGRKRARVENEQTEQRAFRDLESLAENIADDA